MDRIAEMRLEDIIKNGVEYYDDVISLSDSPELFMELSSLRRAALLWYPGIGGRVLEIGAGTGALTGVLCEKASEVVAEEKGNSKAELLRRRYSGRKNLAVITTDAWKNAEKEKFDLIVALDVPQLYGQDGGALLKNLCSLLSDKGKLLAGFRNRFALKYLCGQTDDMVKIPQQSLDPDCSFRSARDYKELIMSAGFRSPRTYYVLPDIGFAQTVFSDEWCPSEGAAERILTYDPFGADSANAKKEHELWKQIRDPNTLRSLANFFIMECHISDEIEDDHVIGAYISADRESPHSFCTRFWSSGRVQKIPLHKDGEKTLLKSAENAEDLRNRGLSVVSQKIVPSSEKDVKCLEMPYVSDISLTERLQELLNNDTDGATALLRQLEKDILKSSEPCGKPAPQFSFAPGPYLKTGYIDMIPFNAFWSDGKIKYFDQEFTLKACPVSYILYRAIRYSWLSLPDAESCLPIEDVEKTFDLCGLWDKYTEIEDEFTNANRCRSKFAQVYRWAWQGKPYKTGFIMGTFDLFHKGHLNLIRRAKQRCEILRVGVLSDELVMKYKGRKPVIPMKERLEIISAIRYVDEAVAIDGEYVSKIAEWHKKPYDCFFSGDDYIDNEYWKKEAAELDALGSRIEFLPYTKEVSTTMLRKKIEENKR